MTNDERQRQIDELNKELLTLMEAESRDLIKTNCQYFVQNYVYIEDKESPEGISKFNLWPEQIRALKEILQYQFTIILKSRQLGLTWLVLAIVLWMMLNTKRFLAIAISKRDDPDAVEMSLRMQLMLRHLPEWLMREKKKAPRSWKGYTWEANDHEVIIHRTDGEPSRFLTLPASPDTAHSFTANVVILDEWALHPFDEAIWRGAFPTMNRAGYSGKIIGLSTGRRNTLFEKIWNKASSGLGRFHKIFLSWRADPRRDDKWYQDTKADFPNDYKQQYPEIEEDAFSVGEGAFFEEWNSEVHVPVKHWEPPRDRRWPVIGSYDPGFATHACFKWYTISPEGWARCFREYYPHRATDSEQIKTILEMSRYQDGAAMDFYYVVADSDAWTPSRDSGKSTAQLFAENGLSMRQADKDLHNGWRRLHDWLKPFKGKDGEMTAMLTFTYDCANTIRTYPTCEQSETKPEDIALKCESHPQDVDRYFVMSRPLPIEAEEERIRRDFDRDTERDERDDKDSPFN